MSNTKKDFLEAISEFSPLEARIARYLVRNRRATVTEISNEFNISYEEAESLLEHISQIMNVSRYERANVIFYTIDKFDFAFMQEEVFPSGPVIPLVYQFNLLTDFNRTNAFKKAIKEVVRADDSVIDLGCGNAILSIFASEKARVVNSLEINPDVFNFADFQIRNLGLQNKIHLHFGDALKFKIEGKADVVICEMLDTGLIDELEVEVMNYAVKNLLKNGGKVIPSGVENYIQLIYKDFHIFGLDYPLPHFEAYGNPVNYLPMSNNLKVLKMEFNKVNELFFKKTIKFAATNTGVVNAFRLTTKTFLTPDIVIGGSEWLNPPFIFPFRALQVNKGDSILLNLSYRFGGGIESVKYSVEKQKN